MNRLLLGALVAAKSKNAKLLQKWNVNFSPIPQPSQVAQLIKVSVLTPIHQNVMGSNPAGVKRTFIKIFISILRNLIILLCSMVATREKIWFECWGLWVLRFFSFFTANIAPIRSYVAEATFQSERTRELTLIQAAQCLGFTLGPGIQATFAPIGCSALAASGLPYFSLDTYTSCGWFTALLGLICLGLFFPNIFVEHNVLEMEASRDVTNVNGKSKHYKTTYQQ